VNAPIARPQTDLVSLFSGSLPELNDVKLALTDVVNARRFISIYGDRVRFDIESGQWLVYCDDHWEPGKQAIMPLAKELAHKLIAFARGVGGEEKYRNALTSMVRLDCSAGSLRAMLEVASTEPGAQVTGQDIDHDRALVNFTNGTLDLSTGALREHRSEDLITKVLDYPFDPNATCPEWLGFLDRAMGGSRELIDFLQRFTGAALAADLNLPGMLICNGPGSNGKSTFAEGLRAALGPYSAAADASQLIAKRRNERSSDPHLVRIRGSRLAITTETGADTRLDEARVKALLSGERIEARTLYAAPFEFLPTFKILLTSNHLPVIRGMDAGIWRRIFVVPWTVSVPASQQDIHLLERLKKEAPGIMAWIVAGANAVRRMGSLCPPSSVIEAVAAYHSEMDVAGRFIESELVPDSAAHVLVLDAFAKFNLWVEHNGATMVSQKEFGQRMAQCGHQSERSNTNGAGGRYVYKDLRMRA
jgi:putative DNA primase/helicase